MPKTFHYTMLSRRDLAASFGLFIVLGIALLGLAYWWLDPNPPKRVTLTTGPAQSAYEEFDKRYAKILAQDGSGIPRLMSKLRRSWTRTHCTSARWRSSTGSAPA